MKAIYLCVFILFFTSSSFAAQDINGNWYGQALVGGMKLRIEFNLKKSDDTYSGFMVSPDQSPQRIPLTAVEWDGVELNITVTPLGFSYKGTYVDGNEFHGSFSQMGAMYELNLSRDANIQNRPQEPQPPYPYRSEEVAFSNEEAGIRLAGTLTLPPDSGRYPAVVMITGSGPQNRNEELMGHKPFWVIADYLTRHGFAVLRYDERGVGESEGIYAVCGIPDFAADAASAIAYLKSRPEIDAKQIGIIGHSEGGAVATVLAAKKVPAFIVSLAGLGVDGREVMRSQREAIFRLSSAPDEFITQYNQVMAQIEDIVLNPEADHLTRQEQIKKIVAGTPLAGQEETVFRQMTSQSMLSLLRYNPAEYFPHITCPVLALNGDKDVQVLAAPNLEGFRQIASNGNQQVTVKEYPGLNHLFQTATTGLPVEYGQIEETIHPEVLEDIVGWIFKK